MKAPSVVAAVVLAAGVAACATQPGGQRGGPPVAAPPTAIPAATATASPIGGATASPLATIPPTASPPPARAGRAALTTADNGAAVRLRPGQRVTVALAAQGLFSWHVPAAAGAAVRKTSASGGYPGRRPARAQFLALRPGTAILTSIDDTACLHARPACLPPQQAWRVTVIVTGNHQAP